MQMLRIWKISLHAIIKKVINDAKVSEEFLMVELEIEIDTIYNENDCKLCEAESSESQIWWNW